MHRLEHGDALSSELWACLTGLRLSWDMGFRKIILESDSTCVIELLTSNLNTSHAEYSLHKEIHDIINRDWEIKITFASRDSNGAVDLLAKWGLNVPHGFHFVTSIPNEL